MQSKIARCDQLLTSESLPLAMAFKCHRTHKNKILTFSDHLYLVDLYRDTSRRIVVRKSTQCGVSEWLVLLSIFKAIQGRGVFYVMPTDQIKNRFVKNRFDRVIEYVRYYKEMIHGGSMSKFSESTSLKHIGKGSIAFIGSNSSAGFTEFPADDVIIDEYDECDQDNLSMAPERQSASDDPKNVDCGNPTIEGYGIDYQYSRSDKKQWFIKCPHCNEQVSLDFFVHIVKEIQDKDKNTRYLILDQTWKRGMKRDIYPICHKCGKPLDRHSAGEWVKQDSYSDTSGYYISKLFSSKISIIDILDRFQEGLKDDSKKQRFYNGDLGLAYTASGAKITSDMLNKCIANYNMPDRSTAPTIMGIDVGNLLHVRISNIMPDGKVKAAFIGTVRDEKDVSALHRLYNVRAGCIDALPEQRLSKKICGLPGMFRVFYGKAKKDTIDLRNRVITVDRTASLDAVKEMILMQNLILPQNAGKLLPLTKEGISEYYFQMCASTRVFDDKSKSYKWVEGSLPDHYFHAENYGLIAKKILAMVNK